MHNGDVVSIYKHRIQTHCNIFECVAMRRVVVVVVMVVVYIETCRPNSILVHSGPIHALRRSSYIT